MREKRPRLGSLSLIATWLCLPTLSWAGGPWLPENVSLLGGKIDRLYNLIFAVTALMFVGVHVALIWFLLRYRAKAHPQAIYTHGSNKAETIWTVLPGLFLFWLALYQRSAWVEAKIAFPKSEDAVRVQVLGQQFFWNFRYPGPDGEFATDDDIVQGNNLYVPVDKPVLLQIRAMDVIHSLYLPNFRLKQDAVPGLTTTSWFQATRTGEWEIACAELCGMFHYRMKGRVIVLSQVEFEQWLQEKVEKQTGPAPAGGWDWEAYE